MEWYAAAMLASTAYQSYAQRRAARKNRGFQESMSSTAHQRSVEDMKAAGINPMVAYSSGGSGGASTPQGSVERVPDIGEGVSTALQAKKVGLEEKLMKSQETVNSALALKTTAEKTLTDVSIKRAKAELKKFKKEGSGISANIIDTTKKQIKGAVEVYKKKAFAPGERKKIKKRTGESLRAFKYRREVRKMPKAWQKKHRKHKHSHDIQRGKERR